MRTTWNRARLALGAQVDGVPKEVFLSRREVGAPRFFSTVSPTVIASEVGGEQVPRELLSGSMQAS